jgi:hypothetical protein
MRRRWPDSENLTCIMKDTECAMQKNVGAGTSVTRLNSSQALLTQKPTQTREGAIRLQVSSSLWVRLPGARRLAKRATKENPGSLDTGDEERERERSRP